MEMISMPIRVRTFSRRFCTALALLAVVEACATPRQPSPPSRGTSPAPATKGAPAPAAGGVSATPQPDSVRRAAIDTLKRHSRLGGDAVRPGSWHYTTTLRVDTTFRLLGEVEIRVAESTYAGAPSWLLTEVGLRSGAVVADSLWVTRDSLRPQHWSATQGPARLVAEFTRDTIYSAITAPTGRRSLVAPSAPKLLVNQAMSDLIISLLPLEPLFQDSLAIVAIDVGAVTVPPAQIVVEGAERVVVPAGTFDAWIVSLESERGGARVWVSKDEGSPPTVLRTEQTLPAMGGAVLRRDLLRVN